MYLGEISGLKIGQATRDAFGDALKDLGDKHPEIVTVDGDVGNSTRTEVFAKAFPERGFNVGIAESNMVSVAGGLASTGHIPVVASFAAFLLCNAYDQIRMSIAFPGMNVKMVGTHAGISIGEDGPSQMGIEDVSLACSLPGVVVMVTADAVSTKAATAAMVEHNGPVYLRLGRPNVAEIYSEGDTFEIGKANTIREGDDVTIIANGLMVAGAVDAATKLAEEGISARVIDMHTVKPIDVDAIQKAARETGAIVVAEEHLAHGGLGSAVSMVVSQSTPVPMAYVNVGDCFAESGDPQGLLDKYGLTADAIVEAVKKVK
ncbi:transketolase family protein [Gimesia aquarii]|uniref:1-deoxy-D-xylulose-5-phosphate synthase n=1 Tax=Gimesia aquarii TaxID=2527964 RepID=A0A517WPV5_9PLAN|nr:transketolase C-terminal domain-containing protein [Gimesia aquarii]QDU07268.1 1-deoxy-D-xylulose-5-phosphate synthase [Gimesia aquarii]